MIKAAGQSRATYGAAVDAFTVAPINTLRGKTTGLLLIDKGESMSSRKPLSTGSDKQKEDYILVRALRGTQYPDGSNQRSC
eukprot:5001725-Heterocapsa_arctica.AAC.1